MYLRLLVASIVIAWALPSYSLQQDSIKAVHRIAVDAVPAKIFHTNDFLRGGNEEERVMNHDMTFTLKYAFMNPDEVRPGSIHQGAYQGVGLARHEFNRWLSNPISVYLFQGAPIINLSRRVSLNYEWNLGMAFGWNAYDEETNPENKVIGSKVTAYIDVDMYLRWMLSRYIDLNAGISLSHFSNGNTTYPNLGLNTGGIRLGMAYYINRVYDKSASRENDDSDEVNHTFGRQVALGLSARSEFAMPYFSINFGVGTYVLGNRNNFRGVYEVLALKVHISQRAMLHIGYSLVDFKTPNNLMLGLGSRCF